MTNYEKLKIALDRQAIIARALLNLQCKDCPFKEECGGDKDYTIIDCEKKLKEFLSRDDETITPFFCDE